MIMLNLIVFHHKRHPPSGRNQPRCDLRQTELIRKPVNLQSLLFFWWKSTEIGFAGWSLVVGGGGGASGGIKKGWKMFRLSNHSIEHERLGGKGETRIKGRRGLVGEDWSKQGGCQLKGDRIASCSSLNLLGSWNLQVTILVRHSFTYKLFHRRDPPCREGSQLTHRCAQA